MICLAVALAASPMTGQQVLDQVAARLKKVRAISVTLKTTYPLTKRTSTERFSVLKGGYLRYVQSGSIALVSPKAAWVILPSKKLFQWKPAPPPSPDRNPFLGMPGLFGDNSLPAIGVAESIVWHGRDTYRVTIDARKNISMRAKLVYFFDRRKLVPVGFHFNPGSYDADGEYTSLELDPPLKPADFEFAPGPGWKPLAPPGSRSSLNGAGFPGAAVGPR